MAGFSLDKDLLNFKDNKGIADVAVFKDYIGDIKRWRKTGSHNGYIPPIVMLDLIQCRRNNEGKLYLNQDLIRLIGDYCCENKLVIINNEIDDDDEYSFTYYLEIVDIDTGIKKRITGDIYLNRLSVMNESTIVTVGWEDVWYEFLQVWDLNSGTEIKWIRCVDLEIISCIATINEHTFVTGSGPKDFVDGEYTLKIWDLSIDDNDDVYENNLKMVLVGHTYIINCIAVIDSKTLISGSSDNTIRLWNTEKKTALVTWECDTQIYSIALINVTSTEFSFVCGLRHDKKENKTLQLWNIKINTINQDKEYILSNKTVLYGHERAVNGVAVLNSNTIVSGSDDRTIRIWDIEKGIMLQKISDEIDSSLSELTFVKRIKKINKGRFISFDSNGIKGWQR